MSSLSSSSLLLLACEEVEAGDTDEDVADGELARLGGCPVESWSSSSSDDPVLPCWLPKVCCAACEAEVEEGLSRGPRRPPKPSLLREAEVWLG